MADKRVRVFISWSKSYSKEIAKILKKELYAFFNEKIDFWVSSQDISSGNVAINSIINALQSSDMIITCLDSNNYKNPWLYFETGAVFARKYKDTGKDSVSFPIIFDELTVDDLNKTPFHDLQLMKFNEDQFREMLESINNCYKKITKEELLSKNTLDFYFDSLWNNVYSSVNNIIAQRNNGVDNVLNTENVIERLKKYPDFPEAMHGKIIKYSSGFETEYFYKFLLENVKERLYIFGRKNKKIFSNDLKSQFENILNNKIDLRMLYISPESNEVKNNTAQDIKDFRLHLIASIKIAAERFDQKYNIEDYCKIYNVKRDSEIIIADNVVFYKDLGYTKDGKPAHFTGKSFNVVSIDSIIGADYYKKFIEIWDSSVALSKEYVNNLK